MCAYCPDKKELRANARVKWSPSSSPGRSPLPSVTLFPESVYRIVIISHIGRSKHKHVFSVSLLPSASAPSSPSIHTTRILWILFLPKWGDRWRHVSKPFSHMANFSICFNNTQVFRQINIGGPWYLWHSLSGSVSASSPWVSELCWLGRIRAKRQRGGCVH